MPQAHKAQRHSGSHVNFPINRVHKRVKRDAFFARNNQNRATRRAPLRASYAAMLEERAAMQAANVKANDTSMPV